MEYREDHLLQTIARSKAAFLEGEGSFPLSLWEFVYQQGRYIRKRWWCLQGLFLLVLLWILPENYVDIRRGLGAAAPLFVVLALPELWKSRSSNAMEVEAASYYSLRQIYAARMTLFSLVDTVLVSLFILGLNHSLWITLGDLIASFLLPFSVSCCICLRCLYCPRIGSEAYSLLLCGIWTVLWDQILIRDRIYNAISLPVWCALLALSLLYLGWCIFHGQRQGEKIWEVQPVWS